MISTPLRVRSLLFCASILMLGFSACGGPKFANPVAVGTVEIGALRQASGIALSRTNPGVLWTHNDAGDTARVFALSTTGQLLGTYSLAGVNAVDFEDIAIGPGPVPGIDYLFIGDIGDNNETRNTIAIYEVPEPAVYTRQAANPPAPALKGVRAITLTYPDHPHNAEALCVDPLTGSLYIATKESGISHLYKATKTQLDAGGAQTLASVGTLDFNLANGASISPTGREIIIRQEDFALLWNRSPGQLVESALAGRPIEIPVVGRPDEPNGEAIGFDPIGRGYYTLSDSANIQPLYFFDRTSAFPFSLPQTLLPAGATWRYLDSGVDQKEVWRLPAFNDSAWKTGDGPFGYGDGDERTTVGFGGKSTARFITTYFRKTFTVSGRSEIGNLLLRVQFDDGVAVYLNGAAVARVNLSSTAAFGTLASGLQEDLEDAWFTFSVDPALLVDGLNTIAVEVHQQAANSPDLSFDLQLLAVGRTPLRPSGIVPTPDGHMTVEIEGPIGSMANVEFSRDLETWLSGGAIPLPGGVGVFQDAAATTGQCFYRVLP